MKTKKEWVDARGEKVPDSRVTKLEKKRERIARRICTRWEKAELLLRRIKIETLQDIEDLQKCASDASDAIGGAKGNTQFRSFDGTIIVSKDIQDIVEYDERRFVAQRLVLEAAHEIAAKNNDKNVVEIVSKFLRPRKSGKLDTQRIRDLLDYKVDHPKWEQGCAIFRDCAHVVDTKLYLRVSRKYTPEAKHVPICLDIAAI